MKEVPQDAEIPSHQLMLRAGLIRKLSSGLYTFLPLGLRALRKVEQIVREEMDRAGALEVLMPAVQPADLWARTGRLESLNEVMFHVRDRQDRELVLGPTHEEVITDLCSRELSSYKQLPVNFYQIQTKFRDEIRPRFGLMRAKEFIMKDAYSFDVSWDAADGSYQAMYDAYIRVFKRCGLQAKVVEADSGAMGGSWSHEFMVLADAGEDGIVECSACDYAANLEKATCAPVQTLEYANAEASPEDVHTPEQRSIAEVAAFLDSPPDRLIKTLIYAVDGEPVAVLLPGNREVNELKLARLLEGEVALAGDELIQQVTGAPTGFAGPVGLEARIIADHSLKGVKGAITGANKEDYHLLNVDLERDANVDDYLDLSFALDGDGCPNCGGRLNEKRGIEVGHVFKLGTKYAEALGAKVLDENGKEQVCVMGCYGIGVTRTLQSVIEQCHDGDGIIWPPSVAPFQVEVLTLNMKHAESVEIAERLVADLENRGCDVLYDDRKERPGIKFKDADLLGLPVRVAVGERSLAEGMVELKVRSRADKELVPVDDAVETVVNVLNELMPEA